MLKRFWTGVLVGLTVVTLGASPKRHYDSSRLIVTLAAQKNEGPVGFALPANGDGHLDDFKKLALIAKAYGVEIVGGTDMDDLGLYGLTDIRGHVIYLNVNMDNAEATEVLIHELAHVLTPTLKFPEDDIVAQGVAYVVGSELGIDCEAGTVYYEQWLMHGSLEQAQILTMRNAKEIDRVANFILKALGR